MKTMITRGYLIAVAVFAPGLVLAGSLYVTPYLPKEDAGAGDTRTVAELPPVEVENAENKQPASENTSAESSPRPFFRAFPPTSEGVGDAAVNVLGEGVEYKLNAANYNIKLGRDLSLPFQVFFGDFASDESPEDSNEQKLIDPTQGLAIQFPLVHRLKGRGSFCKFSNDSEGSCNFGGDVTLRGVKLNETDASGEIKDKSIFGASAALQASLLFPIFDANASGSKAGWLGITIGARYFYHKTNEQDLLFGEIADPDGKAIKFKKGFSAAVAQAELGIFEHFSVRLEYFGPFNNKDVLDDVFKASIVLTPKN